MVDQRSVADHVVDEYAANDNIEELATELSAMDAADASLYGVPARDWRRVDLVDMTNRLWYWMPSGHRPHYWQKPSHHEVMSVHELQGEANCRRLKLLHADSTYVLEVLRVNSEALVNHFRGLRHKGIRALQFLIVKHEVDIDIEYPHSREYLAFLIADRLARDAVDEYNASLLVDVSSEQKAQNDKPAVNKNAKLDVADTKDQNGSEQSSTAANVSKKRAHTDVGPDSPHKKPKVSSTSAENVNVGSDAGSDPELEKKQTSPASSAPGAPGEAESAEYIPKNNGEQPDRELSEGEVSEDESTAKCSKKNKVPKSVMKRFIID